MFQMIKWALFLCYWTWIKYLEIGDLEKIIVNKNIFNKYVIQI